jgi:hypothetical protein
MADMSWMETLRSTAPVLSGAFSGLGAYLGVLSANQRGLRALETLLFAANLIQVQASQLQGKAPRNAQDYEIAVAMDIRARVRGLLRHVNVADLPKEVHIRALARIEALANNQQVMVERAAQSKAGEDELDRFLANTIKGLDKETPLLEKERDHLKRWVGVRWLYPTPWREKLLAEISAS